MKKRIFALFLSFFLVFQINVIGYSQAVVAGEFIPAAVEFVSESQAFQFLCGLMGVTPSTAFVASAGGVAVAGTLMMQKFEQWVIEQAYPVNVAMWLSKLKSGVIDKKDECFSVFKSWISSLSSNQVDESYSYGTFLSSGTLYEFKTGPNDSDRIAYTSNIPFAMITYSFNNRLYYCICGPSPSSLDFKPKFMTYLYSSSSGYYNYSGANYNMNTTSIDGVTYYYYSVVSGAINDSFTTAQIHFDGFTSFDTYIRYCIQHGIFNQIPSDGVSLPSDLVLSPGLDKLLNNGAIDDLDLDQVNKLPIGVQIGDITIALDNVIDKLGSIESVLERIISGDLAIDKVRQAADVVPVSKTKEGNIEEVVTEDDVIPVDDYVSDPNLIRPVVIPPSYNADDYTVNGLQDVFPFCIPFDLMDFISVLKADPVAPHFTINCAFLGERFKNITFDIDFKDFNQVASLTRKCELLLFCIGLLMVTRNLIKG